MRRLALAALAVATVAIALPLPSTAGAKPRKKAEKTGKSQDSAKDLRPTVAVLYFDYSGKDEELAMLRKGLAQMVISDLSAIESVRIVERDRLQEIIAEMKLQKSNRFDKATAAKIGKLLGARYMVLGGYFALMGSLRVDARVVEVETGKVVRSIGASGKQDDFIGVQQKLSAGLAEVLKMRLPKMQLNVARASTKRPARRKKRPAPPKSLTTQQAAQYAKALDAKDRGDVKLASATLKQVVKAKPDFALAAMDLASLAQ